LRRGRCTIKIVQLVVVHRQQLRLQEVAVLFLLLQELPLAMHQREQLLEQDRHLMELLLEPMPRLEVLVEQQAHQQVVTVALPEPFHHP